MSFGEELSSPHIQNCQYWMIVIKNKLKNVSNYNRGSILHAIIAFQSYVRWSIFFVISILAFHHRCIMQILWTFPETLGYNGHHLRHKLHSINCYKLHSIYQTVLFICRCISFPILVCGNYQTAQHCSYWS